MWRIYRWSFLTFFLVGFAATGAALFSASCQKSGSQTPISIQVEQSGLKEAKAYYTETFNALGIKPDLDNNEPGLAVMLQFLGYKDLTPKTLEDDPSETLMKRFGDDLMASAFFAPKITDVSQDPKNINVGWRKVIRLRSRLDSDAARRGIRAGYVLFNKFQGTDRDADPFEPRKHESQTTQLILMRAEKSPNAEPLNRPLHFFVYGPVSEGAKLKFALQASFDAASPEIEAKAAAKKGPIKDYFVPLACGQCHGGLKFNDLGDKEVNFAKQKVNFLDTDHWFDRIQDGDDFAFLQQSKFPVLFDGDKDQTSPRFAAAFDVLRRLNAEIKTQNEVVEDPAKPSFQFRAISKWLQLHASDNSNKDVFSRALDPLPSAGAAWDSNVEVDKQLLPRMNQYCYRCHSSIAYNIFDRPEVACRKSTIRTYLNLDPGNPKHMPQDRVLDKTVQDEFLGLILKLPDTKCSK
jgi:hypothetical protein